MKANVKKHVIIASLSAVCVAMVCVIAAQFNTKLPAVENVAEGTTETEITVEITAKPKEEKETIVTSKNTVEDENTAETADIQYDYDDFIENGGIKVDQSFEKGTKSETPPPPEIADTSALTDPTEPPKYESEQVEIKPQVTEPPSDTPKHGDKKDGKIYINGFGWVADNGGGGTNEYVTDMYENGNKIGYFG